MHILQPRTPDRIKVQSYYSGKKGFYCSMYPTSESLARLVKHFSQVPQLGDRMVAPPLQHVTVMYSDHAIPIPELPWITRDVILRGRIIGYDLFIKPHKTEGAVVALLESADLTSYHSELEKMAEYTWDEYKPHLTVAYDVTPTDAAIIISALAALPLPAELTFTAPVFEDKS